MQCPTQKELKACLLGKVADARAEMLLQHAEWCSKCGAIVEELDQHSSDGVTESLRQLDPNPDLDAACQRMMDRSERFVPAEYMPEPDATKQHLLQGTKIRDYEILHPIGEGGMGAVFLARHNRLDTHVALKVLSLQRSHDPEAQRRFEQEMTIVGKLQHPGIVRALDAGEDDGVQYLVMELIEGADLRQIVSVLGPLPVSDACEICRQAALALDYAHHQQLIHRDVKPSNLMLSNAGMVKVMDLGLARFTDQSISLTSTHQAMGSLDFMAPEQLQAADVDQRVDVYSLACTLHFLLLGASPHRRRTASLMVSRTPKLDAAREIVPPPILKLLQQMLVHDPARRTTSLQDVARQLAPYCGAADLVRVSAKARAITLPKGGDLADTITSSIEQTRPKKRAARWWVALAAGVAMTAAIATAYRGMMTVDVPELRSVPSVNSNLTPVPEVPLFQLHGAAVRCLAFNDSTSQLICGSDDATITVRDLPNQNRIVRVCMNHAAISKIQIVADDRVVCIDSAGYVVALQLPKVEVCWRRRVDAGIVPEFHLISDTKIRVGTSEHGVSLRLEDGRLLTHQLTETLSESVAEFLPGATLAGKAVSIAGRFTPSMFGVLDENLVRVIAKDELADEHFVYAEHTHPISAVLFLPSNTMAVTADESGEIRLWHAPNSPRSDMLLGCQTKIDSAEMTFKIHRRIDWSEDVFSKAKLYSPPRAGMGSSFAYGIERQGNTHVFEHVVDLEERR